MKAIKPMEEVTACNIPRLSSVHHEANLDDCLKVIYSCWEGKQPSGTAICQSRSIGNSSKGFSCPPSCLMSPWEVSHTKEKTPLNLPLIQFLLPSGVPVRGVQPSVTVYWVLRPQEPLTLPYTACLALISPWP